MLPLLTAADVKALDMLAEGRFGLAVDLLMEHAGRSVADIAAALAESGRAVVFVGPGNNGGDGLVAARHLAARGLSVTVVLAAPPTKVSSASAVNLDRWRRFGGAVSHDLHLELNDGDLVVDALLGTGLARPPEGLLLEAILAINAGRERGAHVVAVDVPSGVDSDTGAVLDTAVRAELTVTLAAHKRGLWQEPGASAAGAILVGSLGLPPAALSELAVETGLLELSDVRALLPRRAGGAFKNTFGHLLLVAGGPGKAGAAALATRGALRSGAGLVTLAAGEAVLGPALSGYPEAMSIPLASDGPFALADATALLPALVGKQALAMGPGLSRREQTGEGLAKLLEAFAGPSVLDADALNAIAGVKGLLLRAKGPTVVTPHPGEMGRLCGCSTADVQADRFGTAERFAREQKTVVVLKGAKTIVASPEGALAVVPTGGPGLAHGGTGDVLCGLIGGLLAQGLAAFDAARAGAYLHGLAGDRVVQRLGQRGLAAGDVAEALGPLWAELVLKLGLADLAATQRLGEGLGKALQPGDFIGLTGDLGAGKTALARSIAFGAGVAPDEVSSPTFALINAYAGRLPVHHADLYRLTSRDELFATGYFDLLEAEGALLVEWVENVKGATPQDWLELRLRIGTGDSRELEALAHGPRGEALLGVVRRR